MKFKRLYDIKKDHLKIEMTLDLMRYAVYKDGVLVDTNRCNQTTKDELLQKQKEYKQKLNNRRDKLSQTNLEFHSLETISQKKLSISEDMKKLLMPLVFNEEVVLGIHRVGITSDESIIDMLNNGVELTGHGTNVQMEKPDLELNFGVYLDNRTILKEIANANTYKNSKGSIIVCVPIEDFKDKIYITDEHGTPKINPKYIVGYFPVNERHCIDTAILPQKTNQYNQTESGLSL